jgi:hypothetical protein
VRTEKETAGSHADTKAQPILIYGPTKQVAKNALYEGHGFSRAVNVLRGGGFRR